MCAALSAAVQDVNAAAWPGATSVADSGCSGVAGAAKGANGARHDVDVDGLQKPLSAQAGVLAALAEAGRFSGDGPAADANAGWTPNWRVDRACRRSPDGRYRRSM